jgi:hypothetical protein
MAVTMVSTVMMVITATVLTADTTVMAITTTGVTSIFLAVATTEDAMSGLIVSADIKAVGQRTLAAGDRGIRWGTPTAGATAAVAADIVVVAEENIKPHNALDKPDLIIL